MAKEMFQLGWEKSKGLCWLLRGGQGVREMPYSLQSQLLLLCWTSVEFLRYLELQNGSFRGDPGPPFPAWVTPGCDAPNCPRAGNEDTPQAFPISPFPSQCSMKSSPRTNPCGSLSPAGSFWEHHVHSTQGSCSEHFNMAKSLPSS